MKRTTLKLIGLWITLYLLCSFTVYALENQDSTIINKDQVDGRVEQTKGKIKEVTGKVVGDKQMEVEGSIQKNMGKVQAGYGDLKQDIKDKK